MSLQLSTSERIVVHIALKKASHRIVALHRAYAEGDLRPSHIISARTIRDRLASLIAKFGDGEYYGTIEPDMLQALRHMETAANAFLCNVHGVDDVRTMVA